VVSKSCEGVDGRGVRKFSFFCQESMRRFDMSPFATLVVAPVFVMNLLCGKFHGESAHNDSPFFVVRSQEIKK